MDTYTDTYTDICTDTLLIVIGIIIIIFLISKYVKTKKILITQYYLPKWGERQLEIDECFINNLNNPNIDEIHLFIEQDYDFDKFKSNPNFSKLVFVNSTERLSYKQAFEYSNRNFSSNDIILLANSDIYFNETLSKIDTYSFDKTFYGLTRHEITETGLRLYGRPSVSQDVWIWKPPIQVQTNMYNKDYFTDGIQLGIWGCDNRILKIMKDSDYTIRNIGRDIQCIHNHKNDLRTWLSNPKEVKKKYWEPTKIYYLNIE